MSQFKALCSVAIKQGKSNNDFTVSNGTNHVPLNIHDNADIFEHKVEIDDFDQPWFNSAGGGKDSRAYAQNHGHNCLVSAEVRTHTGSYRKFTSFTDNQAFLTYKENCHERHLFEIIRPNTPVMLFTDHDYKGGLDALRMHQEGVKDVQVLFDLLNVPRQEPVVLTSHRTKANAGDYLSTHLRFPTVSLESCNGTLKLIHHLLKHTGREFGGLDYGTHGAYQQLRIPGCSKAGSKTRLLPADGSPLTDIGSLLANSSAKRQIHITSDMVLAALKSKFGCSNDCGLKYKATTSIPAAEIDHITRQIHTLYTHKTGKDPSSIRYMHGSLWNLDHVATCIHSEAHKSNGMYITVNKRAVFCQCLGRCKETREPVLLGHLHAKLSIESHPWEKTPWSCYQGTLAVDVVKNLPVGFDLVEIGRLLACIGDFKALLDAYAGHDTTVQWTEATTKLSLEETMPTAKEALDSLTVYLDEDSPKKNSRKRVRSERGPVSYKFDFDRFQREHPHPLAINAHTVSSQIVCTRALVYEDLDLSHRVNLLHSEMMTCKTSVVIVKELASLPAHARVIALTPKRLFAESLRGTLRGYGFEFGHYQDEGFFKTRPNRVIIEIESMWKLKHYHFKPFDYLLIDESETTLSQMLCVETHGHHIRNNWDVLIWLLEGAAKVLLCDARMSMISMGFVQDHCLSADIHYIRNTVQIPMTARLFLNAKAMEVYARKTIDDGESLYTFSGGRNNAYNLHAITSEAFGADKSVLYSSNNSGTKKVREELGNVNVLWADKKAIHTTPSITVGTSFDVPNIIKNIFLFVCTLTASPNDVSQASRRVRRPITPVLHYTIRGPCKNVPTTVHAIKRSLSAKSDLLLQFERQRIEKDFEDEANKEQLALARSLIADPGEKSTLIKTAIRVIQLRNLQLRNYAEELTHVFLESGHAIVVDRTTSKKAGIESTTNPEQKVFAQYGGTTGIMAHYEEQEEELETKEKEETLSEDERALLKMVHYISNFSPEHWSVLSYEYWMDYKHKLSKDKRLQMVLQGSAEHSAIVLGRHHRYEISKAEGKDVSEHTGILHSTTIPEIARVNFHAYAKPLFTLFKLLKLSDPEFCTDSLTIKKSSVELQAALTECRILLATNWSGADLPKHPTYAQLLQFLTNMMTVLIDGSMQIDVDVPIKKVTTKSVVETADKRTKSGKTTRKKQERIVGYKLNFLAPDEDKVKSYPLTALDRVQHLLPISREDNE